MNTKEREILPGKLWILMFAVAMVFAMISAPAYAEENDVASISYDPGEDITLTEYVDGYYNFDYKGEEFFEYHYSAPYILGSKLTITDKTGVSTVYTCLYDEVTKTKEFVSESGVKLDQYYLETYDDQSQTHWTKGQHDFVISYMNVDCHITINIVENPIISISFDPGKEITVIENVTGYYDGFGKDEYFRYDWPDLFIPGSKLILTDKDGVSTKYTYVKGDGYDYVSETGDRFNSVCLGFSDDQSEHHWTRNGKNYITINGMGTKCQVPIYVIDNPIASISFDRGEDVVLTENLDGYYTSEDGKDEYFLYQYPPLFIEGSKLTLTDRNGVSTEYTYVPEDFDSVYVSESGDKISINDSLSSTTNQEEKHWTVGGENYITIKYENVDCQIPVTIQENPIASISYTPSQPIVFTEEENIVTWPELEGRRICSFNFAPRQGDTLVVNYKDGSSRTFVYDSEFVDVTNDFYRIADYEVSFEPESEYWKYGPNNYMTVNYLGRRARIKVSYKEYGAPDPVEIPATKLTVASKKLYLKKGDSYKISYILTPLNSSDDVTFTSSNKKIATVSSTGKIKAKGKGTAKITVKTSSGKSIVIKVNVAKKATKTKKVTVAKKLTLKAGAVKFIAYKRKPTKTTDKVTFKSSKKSVVTVDPNGKLIAKKKGTAKITIKSGRKKAVCKITVR